MVEQDEEGEKVTDNQRNKTADEQRESLLEKTCSAISLMTFWIIATFHFGPASWSVQNPTDADPARKIASSSFSKSERYVLRRTNLGTKTNMSTEIVLESRLWHLMYILQLHIEQSSMGSQLLHLSALLLDPSEQPQMPSEALPHPNFCTPPVKQNKCSG